MKAFMTFCLMFGFVALNAADEKAKPEAKTAAEKIVGNWKITSGKKAGADLIDEDKKGIYVFTKDKISIKEGDKEMIALNYSLDTKVTPIAIDMEITASPDGSLNGRKGVGIIEIDGDTLKLCYDRTGKTRPTKFVDDKAYSYVLKREKDEKK